MSPNHSKLIKNQFFNNAAHYLAPLDELHSFALRASERSSQSRRLSKSFAFAKLRRSLRMPSIIGVSAMLVP